MSDSEIRSESELQSESWSTATVYDAVYEKDNTENQSINVVQGDVIQEHDNVAEAEEIYEEYDGDNEEHMPRNKNMRVVQTHENAIEEEVYEEYDGDYQEYMPRYTTYSNKTKSITPKFLTKQILVSLVLWVVCTVGIVVGLSVHFTSIMTMTVTNTTTSTMPTPTTFITTTPMTTTLTTIATATNITNAKTTTARTTTTKTTAQTTITVKSE